MDKAIEMIGISKCFGEVQALKDVRLDVFVGEIHSILGENGAGKSTLMNVLAGIYQPDEGTVKVYGEHVQVRTPRMAIDLGIGMIHQHFKLVNALTAAENIIAGNEKKNWINKKEVEKQISELSVRFGLKIDPSKPVYRMSVAEKQRVEILKVLYRGAKTLILDEPTAVLTPQETDHLFEVLTAMKNSGHSVIIITHKLGEVMSISDRVTIMRKGEYIETKITLESSERDLTNAMVGREVDLSLSCPTTDYDEILLSLKGLSVDDSSGSKRLKDVSFDLRKGEILGIAGVAGSGQKELCEAIAGLLPIKKGEVIYEGEDIVALNPREIISRGISLSFVPEDRLGMGLVSTMDITNNILLKEYHKQKSFFITRKNSKKMANYLVEKLNIDTPGVTHPVRLLSGGNIQKVLLGREIENNPHLIITAYPSRGLDIGSSHLVYDLLNEQKEKGVGIIFVGEDLDVLMGLSDRLIVLSSGRVTGVLNHKSEFDKETIGFMMSGGVMEDGHV
ncbi:MULTISPECIES: ABC transporter ATP-binding protein [unclassified Fusibacter]|uniref:ABC transporter ATP-binding protein n=1 Tax=unclassified Fusibacter TaxID=2624464 RepID=UPI00101213C2|nr:MULTISPECIES: ABC transporter ATP-binding protein [unclassified Fusibacter]MCK8059952.1 ABC transporter ATP-binding protein [Fusibacter sp. A2]NPE22094.1 ABC transporter ATP-binding protein [Fusibacter sp. A1]RXV60873.1 ABC transporter ATP-binding protein [Fusibacter sp. A1]